MKISIITVVFNSVNTISDCINSVFCQTYNGIEYIIIDGGSTDGTLDVLKRNINNFSFLISEKDNGIYDAMNKGVSLATGDIIGILNSDDLFYDENVLLDIAKEFTTNKSLDILYGNIVYVNKNDTNKIVRRWNSRVYYKKFFENGNVPPHPTLYLKKEVYIKSGLFDIQYKFAADYDFMLRIFKKFDFKSKYLNRTIIKMRLGGTTNKSLINIFKGNKEIIKIWKNNNFNLPLHFIPMKLYKRLIQFI